MFSPYYRRARDRACGTALDHCAINVALAGDASRWVLTERGRHAVARDPSALAIGRSALTWDGRTLTITLDEHAAPWPSRLRGVVRLHAPALNGQAFALDGAARHRWRPLAPRAVVEAEFASPGLRWTGTGYWDTNAGDEPLETAFAHWHWSRATIGDDTAILYDVAARDGGTRSLALRCDRAGRVTPFAAPPLARLARTGWGIERVTRADTAADARVVRTLLDAPFYARSLVASRLDGTEVVAMHESLSLTRFDARWVRALLPFRMRRAR